MKDFKAEIKWVDPQSITPYANNMKKHPIHQIDKIASQIATFGFDQPIVVDKHNVIIKGHGRREASLRLGLKAVPVIVQDLDENQARAARIADNKVAESEFDEEMLRFELGTLDRTDFDLSLTGFDIGELDKMMADPVETQDSVDEPIPDEEQANQFIVAVECKNEGEMQALYNEMLERKFSCKLIT